MLSIKSTLRLLFLVAVSSVACGAVSRAASQGATSILPQQKLAEHYYGNDAPWYERNIPFFDCSNANLTQIYYYRWELYKAHLKDLGRDGYIVTEFLDDVGWSWKPYQALNDATAYHIKEGRWLRDRRYVEDYITFMYSSLKSRHFSEGIAAATYDLYLANGDGAFAVKNLPQMEQFYRSWKDHYDSSKGMYYIEPIQDATEYSIASIDASGGKDGFFGGAAFRPTINSFMYGNARAISQLATMAGDTKAAKAYAEKANVLKTKVETNLWDTPMQQFVDRYKANNQYVHYWHFIRGRELAGYAPWVYDLPDHDPKYDASWKHLLLPSEFAGPYGLRTVEPSYQYYMRQYRYAEVDGKKLPECQWNGPSWPFDTTMVLEAMGNLLNNYTQNVVHASDYVRILEQYARQHFLNGRPDLQEDYNPDTGKVIVGLPRSHHYNHSGFTDLIISGLVGLRPRADNILEIHPLIPADPHSPEAINYFCLENVPYHGHNVTVLYDRDGNHYHQGAGLSVYVDGRRVVNSVPLGRVTVPIGVPVVTPVPHPVDLAVNFAKKGFPVPSASINNSADDLYQAVDGRVWFWWNVRNYWSNAGSKAKQDWFALNFGKKRRFSSVRLWFYADGKQFKAPAACRVQRWSHGKWADVADSSANPAALIGNGENTVSFKPVETSKLRLLFANPPDAHVALVEVKAFQ